MDNRKHYNESEEEKKERQRSSAYEEVVNEDKNLQHHRKFN
jgi:hypothetical protein